MRAGMGDQCDVNHTGGELSMSAPALHACYGHMCKLNRLVTNDCGRSRRTRAAVLPRRIDGHASLPELIDSIEKCGSKHVSLQYLITVSRKCRKEKNLARAKRLCSHVCRMDAEIREQLGNYFVPMFVECGSLLDARASFDGLACPSEFSWISLLKGYFDQGNLDCVLHLFDEMQRGGVPHNRHTIVTSLKASARLKHVEMGHIAHNEVYKHGIESDVIIGNTIISMYVKFGLMDEAKEVFEKLPERDVITWNTLMAGYLEHGPVEEVFNCIDMMTVHCVGADNVSWLCCLQACCHMKYLSQGHDVYSAVLKHGFSGDLILGNAAIDMFAKCGALNEARHILDHLLIRDVISWTALMAGYVDNGCGKEALRCLEDMKKDGVSPNTATFVCGLKACGSTGSVEKGRQIKADIPTELYRSNSMLGNSLVDMFAKCGSLSEAQEVFYQLPNRNLIAWNALIAGFVEHGLGDKALDMFKQMQHEGVSPDASTLNCSLKASGLVRSLDRSRDMHSDVVKKGLERVDLICNTLVDVYAKCGPLEDSIYAFDRQKIRDVISWTALISGFADKGHNREALNCFKKMCVAGVLPSAVTMACILKACSGIGAVDVGQELHAEAVKRGIWHSECAEMCSRLTHGVDVLEADRLLLGNALVDMYGKCGNVLDAQDVFFAMTFHDLVSWNALMTICSRQGLSEVVFALFEEMQSDGIHPNEITFLSIISACSHAGLLFKARTYFESMSKKYNVAPTYEHYSCMVDLLGRAGQIQEAVEMLEKMPYQPMLSAWCSLLGACRKWKNVKLGRHAFKSVMKLDSQHAAAFVLMFYIYTDACMWEEAKKIEAMLQALKGPGKSWVEVDGIVHTFNEDDVDDDRYKGLHAKLQQVYTAMNEEGYGNDAQETLDSIALYCRHSERLAVLFGLLHTSEGSEIRIVKNLCICQSCHTTLAFISKMERCNIICKDKISFHDFKNGRCSCGNKLW